MALSQEELLSKLCYYDKRNPNGISDPEIIQSHLDALKKNNKSCACDNCFYGRTPLVEELLKLIPIAKEAEHALSYLADLNGSKWITGDGVGELDMRQRAKALQGTLYELINPRA